MTLNTHSTLLREFEWRGLISDATSPQELDAHLAEGPRSIYCGFDPTADSLHVGSLLPLLALRRVQLAGHRPIVLIGGGTGLIGDPSGKAGERALNPEARVAEWADRLKGQVERYLEWGRGATAAVLVDNYEWLSKLEVIPFLRDTGKHFSVGSMVARESVRARMGRGEAGISYTEFSYQVLQAYDFLCLYRRYGCTMQIGGSDQWGNITAGTDLIRRVAGGTAFGLTLPLVAKADGTKFGKTESGTVWLDAGKTSAYDMYQSWLNTADADAVAFLKYFTFLTRDEIATLEAEVRRHPERREAQRALAREATTLVHGADAASEAETISVALRTGDAASLRPEPEGGAVPGAVLPAEAAAWPLWKVLRQAELVPSTSEARRLIQQGGVEVDGHRAVDANRVLSPGGHTVKLGKRRVFRLTIEKS
jgi:tyrosyl-tRNA synthetase